MAQLKRYLGLLWIMIGPAAIVFITWQAIEKIHQAYYLVHTAADPAARELASGVALNTVLQWVIIILVFLPIAAGMVIFGKYALQGEYEKLPASGNEL